MSDVVIVVGTKRGGTDVDLGDIKQMVGRVGRSHDGTEAIAHVIVESDREVEIRDGFESGKGMEVNSSFSRKDSFYFHLMSEISEGMVCDVVSAEKWYSRSFEYSQGRRLNFKNVFKRLMGWDAIEEVGGGIRATELGKIASELYFHPENIKSWRDNFSQLFELGLEDDNAAIAWALGTRLQSNTQGDFGIGRRHIINDFKSALPLGLDVVKGTSTQCVLWWCSMGGPPSGRLRGLMLQLKQDIGRIKRALIFLDGRVTHWGRLSFFDDIEKMVVKNIPIWLLNISNFPGMTKSRSEYLYNAGVRNVCDIPDVLNNIRDEIDEPFVKALEDIIYEISKKSC